MSRDALAHPALTYREGTLFLEDLSLDALAERLGTPAYAYSHATLTDALSSIQRAVAFTPHLITYAVKANSNLALLRVMAEAGCGADIVSVGELERALRAGIPPQKIVYSGVGKRDDEIEAALRADIRGIHVESAAELDVLESIAARLDVCARIGLRINPDVTPETHPYISTGQHASKFGIDADIAERLLPRILASAHLRLETVACHIGSQLKTTEPLREAVQKTLEMARRWRAAGAPIRSLDAGGGWPVDYGDGARLPSLEAFGAALRAGLGDAHREFELVLEPGRALVAQAGILLTRVLYVKEQRKKRWVIVDAAMTELLRPALYGAYHTIAPVTQAASDAKLIAVDVVGPVCETGDFIALSREVPEVRRGDVLAILTAGAYGAAMSSHYNDRPRAAEVLVEGASYRVIRDRESLDALWADEHLSAPPVLLEADREHRARP